MKESNVISGLTAVFFFFAVLCAPVVFADEQNSVEKNIGAAEKKNSEDKKGQGDDKATVEKKNEEAKNSVREPIVITSQSMTTDQKAQTALFEVNVVAKKGDRTMYADKMLVYYSEEKGSSNIKKIEAEGNVKLVRGDRIVTSKFATYFSEPEEYAVFTGEPRASQGGNVVTGTKITYFMADDHSIVENSKVFIVNKGKK